MSGQFSDDLGEVLSTLFGHHATVDQESVARCLARLAKEPSPVWDADRNRWLITRWAQARTVLRSTETVNDLRKAATTTLSRRLSERLAAHSPSLLFLDAPQHSTARSATVKFLMVDDLFAVNGVFDLEASTDRCSSGDRDASDAVRHPRQCGVEPRCSGHHAGLAHHTELPRPARRQNPPVTRKMTGCTAR